LRIATGLLTRSAFSDADLTTLIAYVHTLDPRRVPDATDSLLRFATIIAPNTDPAQRRYFRMVYAMGRKITTRRERKREP
jgi:hypothetical protein